MVDTMSQMYIYDGIREREGMGMLENGDVVRTGKNVVCGSTYRLRGRGLGVERGKL